MNFFLVGPYESEAASLRSTLDIRCEVCARSTIRPLQLLTPALRGWLGALRMCCRECGEPLTPSLDDSAAWLETPSVVGPELRTTPNPTSQHEGRPTKAPR